MKRHVIYDSEFADYYLDQRKHDGLGTRTKAEAVDDIKAVFNTIIACLKDGNTISRRGFGKFEVRHRKSHMGINPKTGEKMQLPETINVGFTSGKYLKQAVNDD